MRETRWRHLAFFLLPGLGLASWLSVPTGTLLLVNESTEVNISSSLNVFGSGASYALEQQDSSGTAWPCTQVSTTLLRCRVTLDDEDSHILQLLQANVTSGTIVLGSFVFQGYVQPIVESISPAQISIIGGSRFYINFPPGVWVNSIPRFDGMAVRFVRTGASDYKEAAVEFVDSSFAQIVGRAPAMNLAEGDVVSIDLAMNGRTFVPTGLNVSMIKTDTIKVGFIYVGSPDDFGWNYQQNLARLALEERFVGQIETFYVADVEEWGPNECDSCSNFDGWDSENSKWSLEPSDYFGTHRAAVIMQQWIEEKNVRMIVATSYFFQWDCYYMAAAFPHVAFVHATGYLTRPNMANAFPKIYQARFLSGIALAWYIKENKLSKRVGYVSAFPLGETVRAINALKLGMEQVDPEIDVYLTWMFTWGNARLEDLASRRLLEFYGVEGIAQHTDSHVPQLAAADYGKVGIGYNSDMLYTVGDTVLTSTVLVWVEDYAPLLQKVIDGHINIESSSWRGYDHGTQRLSDFSALVSSQARVQIEEEKAKFEAGIDEVFCKKWLTDSKGRVRNGPTNPIVNPVAWEADHLQEGTSCLTDAVVAMSCQEYNEIGECVEFWLLNGIHDTCEPSLRMPDGIQGEGLPNGTCFLGGMDVPDECATGHYLDILGCTKARVGHYASGEIEHPCPLGYFSSEEGQDACLPCAAGWYAGEEGSSACDPCEPGTFGSTAAMSACMTCGLGLYTADFNATECSSCPIGSYSDSQGASTSTCTSCPAGFSTAKSASKSLGECVCPSGYYAPGSSATCLACPEGMTCPFGSDVANFGTDNDARPLLQAGHMALEPFPLRVYKCRSDVACPGGKEGNCGPFRDTTAVACAECLPGSYEDGNECTECGDFGVVPFVLLAAAGVAMVVVLVVFVTGDLHKRSRGASLATTITGLQISSLQVAGVFGSLNFGLIEPLKSALRLASLVAFDLRATQFECIFGGDPVKSFAIRQLMVPASVPIILVALLCRKRRDPKLDVIGGLSNSLGSLFVAFYLSLIVGCAVPVLCYRHVGDAGSSMTNYPSILCFSQGKFEAMVAIGVVGFCLLPLPFLATVLFATFRHPVALANYSRGHNALQVERFRFLWSRFTPECHYYTSVLLVTSVILSFIPVVVPNDLTLQIGLFYAVLGLALVLQARLRPWRYDEANLLDLIAKVVLLGVLLCGGLTAEIDIESPSFQGLVICAAAAFLLFLLAAGVISVSKLWRRDIRFDKLICHHKGSAAAQARLLKTLLKANGVKQVFIDSDNLSDLEGLFDIVKFQVREVVVWLTGRLLTRAWCVGEIVSAVKTHNRIMIVRCEDFVAPELVDPDDLRCSLDESACSLSSYGFSPAVIFEALQQFLSPTTRSIDMTDFRGIQSFESVVAQMLGRPECDSPSKESLGQSQDNSSILVSTCRSNPEAVAAAEVVIFFVQAAFALEDEIQFVRTYGFMGTNQDIERGQALIILLSRTTLQDDGQLDTIQQGVEHGIALVHLSLPDFVFPGLDYYQRILPELRPSDHETLAPMLELLFKQISIFLPIAGSEDAIRLQCEQVHERILAKKTAMDLLKEPSTHSSIKRWSRIFSANSTGSNRNSESSHSQAGCGSSNSFSISPTHSGFANSSRMQRNLSERSGVGSATSEYLQDVPSRSSRAEPCSSKIRFDIAFQETQYDAASGKEEEEVYDI